MSVFYNKYTVWCAHTYKYTQTSYALAYSHITQCHIQLQNLTVWKELPKAEFPIHNTAEMFYCFNQPSMQAGA